MHQPVDYHDREIISLNISKSLNEKFIIITT